jgi:glycosyltransferase involved in cell wall biosynthesis
VDNDRYRARDQTKNFDLLYVSQIIPRKMPDLVVEIMVELGRDYSLQIVGDGHLREWFLNELTGKGVRYEYAGFVQFDEIPAFFQKARVLLFPTRSDPWGVVANEACAAGIPVLTTSLAGAAGELIIHDENGFVLPPVARVWADHVKRLLNDKELYSGMCRDALSRVQNFTYEKASQGIVDAVMASLKT